MPLGKVFKSFLALSSFYKIRCLISSASSVDPTGHPWQTVNIILNMFCLSFSFINLWKNSLVFLQWKKPCNHNCSLWNMRLSQKSTFVNNQDNSFVCIQTMQVHSTTRYSSVLSWWTFSTDGMLVILPLSKQATLTLSCFQMLNKALIHPAYP